MPRRPVIPSEKDGEFFHFSYQISVFQQGYWRIPPVNTTSTKGDAFKNVYNLIQFDKFVVKATFISSKIKYQKVFFNPFLPVRALVGLLLYQIAKEPF